MHPREHGQNVKAALVEHIHPFQQLKGLGDGIYRIRQCGRVVVAREQGVDFLLLGEDGESFFERLVLLL
jgi:hypothetical protein